MKTTLLLSALLSLGIAVEVFAADPAKVPPQKPAETLQQRTVDGKAPPLQLTEQQRNSWRAATEAQSAAMISLNEKLRAARQALFEAGLVVPVNEKLVREKAMAVGQIEADIAVLRARAFSKIEPPLTPEQIQKMKEANANASRTIRHLQGQGSGAPPGAGKAPAPSKP